MPNETASAPVATTQTTSGVATPAPKQAPELDPKFADLARKEKAIRSKAQALKAQEEALKAREASYIPKDQLAKDPLAALAQAGYSQEAIAELLLKGQQPKDPMGDTIQALKAEIEALKKSQDDQTTSTYKQAITQIKKDAEKLVASSPEFETVKATGSIQDVVDLIELTWKEDGEYLSVEEAAKQVEEHLLNEAIKLAGLKKVQEKLKPAAPVEAEAEATSPYRPNKRWSPKITPLNPDGSRKVSATTLTNQQAVSRPLTAKERAILAFKGELK